MRAALVQAGTLGRRAVIRTARQPANVIFPLIFPMLLVAVNAGGLKAETNLPGFPTNSIRGFVLLVGQLGGLLTIAVAQAIFYLAIGLAFGVRLETGIAGAALLLVLEM